MVVFQMFNIRSQFYVSALGALDQPIAYYWRSHHRISPAYDKQDLNLRRTLAQTLLNEIV